MLSLSTLSDLRTALQKHLVSFFHRIVSSDTELLTSSFVSQNTAEHLMGSSVPRGNPSEPNTNFLSDSDNSLRELSFTWHCSTGQITVSVIHDKVLKVDSFPNAVCKIPEMSRVRFRYYFWAPSSFGRYRGEDVFFWLMKALFQLLNHTSLYRPMVWALGSTGLPVDNRLGPFPCSLSPRPGLGLIGSRANPHRSRPAV